MPGIDFHTHLAPVFDTHHPPTEGVAVDDDGRLVVDGERVGMPRLYDPPALLSTLDRLDLDAAVVSIPPPFFRPGLSAADAATWAAAANAGLRRATDAHDRLLPLAYLPLDHPEVAVRVYEKVQADTRWAGVVGSAGGGAVSLADPAFEPLWAALDRDRRLMLLHPGSSPDARLDEFYLSNLLGNPVETALAAAQLVFGDVLRRFAGMRVLLVHCGGCVPSLVGRWERGLATERPGVRVAVEPPRAALRRVFVDCLAHDPAAVDAAVGVFGADRLVLGSDWPFPMGTDDPAALVAHLGPDGVRRVAVDNAAAALGRK